MGSRQEPKTPTGQRIENENTKLIEKIDKANADGKLSRSEIRKIGKQANLVMSLKDELNKIDKNKIIEIKEKLKNVPEKTYKDLNQSEKSERNTNFKKSK